MARSAQVTGMLMAGMFLMGVSSCNWSLPALQERIGQQDHQFKVLQAENAKFRAEIDELLEEANILAAQLEQARQDLKTQIQRNCSGLSHDT
jgi:cell division protein FtsB